MGSTLKFDSERRELVRERRDARIERKRERRQGRERKHAPVPALGVEPSGAQRAADERVREEVDRIVAGALERHDDLEATAVVSREAQPEPSASAGLAPAPPRVPKPRSATVRSATPGESRTASERLRSRAQTAAGPRLSGRERDIAEFRERRQQCANEVRREAKERIARTGEPTAVADALAAIAHQSATCWSREREQVDQALQSGRIPEVGAAARRAVWAVSRDAARTSRRAGRDPDLALAVCVAYAILARLPRTAVRSAQRTRPEPLTRPPSRRAFWR